MSNNDLAHKIFNALFDDEDLNEMHNIGFIAQPLGYQISSVATIELELDSNRDRMVEEIAELKSALLEIKNTPDVQCDECPSIASAALAKLNQEGEG